MYLVRVPTVLATAARHRVRRGLVPIALLGLAVGCTGSIGREGERGGSVAGAGGSGGGARAGTGNLGGTGGSGAPSGGGVGTGDPDGPDAVPATTRFARLSHKQWENTVRALLKLPSPTKLSESFTGDNSFGTFDNEGGLLQVSPNLWSDYQRAAETLSAQVAGDTTARQRLLPASLPADATARARAFVTSFGRRAFRRPLSTEEVDRYAQLFAAGATLVGSADATADGVQVVVQAMLQSPFFIYRTELGTVTGGKSIPLDDFEIASKLAYTLTNGMPDDELGALADAGMLRDRSAVRKQAQRLLASDAGKAAVDDFHGQLLRLRTYDGIEKDKTKYPLFSAGIGADMRQETLLFTREVVFAGAGGVRELLLSPTTFVNKRLAPLYDLPSPASDGFQKVSLDASRRAGLLTQVGFLASNAYRDEVDSIHRGVFVHHNVLCTELPPPAANVPPVPASGGKTNRERVENHTGQGTCGAACHGSLINPVGFAFEEFDALGRFRSTDNGQPIDASGTMSLGGAQRHWSNAVELANVVAESREAHACYARQWLEYLYGRRSLDEDANLLARLTRSSLGDRAAITSLIFDLVTSDAFLTRTAP